MDDANYNLDMILSSTGEKLLTGAGTISHDKAIEKAKAEYRKYQVKIHEPDAITVCGSGLKYKNCYGKNQ